MLSAFIRHHLYSLILLCISAILILANWTPGTFLTGWDTLHPEFNFPLAFERTINGVWRRDQALGTVAIQSHMAELPRIFFLWLSSFLLPLDALRYLTMLLPLIFGPLGIYILIRSLFHPEMKFRQAIAFLGGLAYLANMGTVQHFVVPLEMFALQYGLLPWVVFSTFAFLEHGKRKKLLLFILTMIGMIGQAHTATLFYAFFGGFLLIVFSAIAIERRKQTILRGGLLIAITILLNSFWLLPNLYAVVTQAEEVKTSKINRLFSPEAFAKNQVYGNPIDAAIVRNFLFDWQLYDYQKQQLVDVVGPWKEHLKHPFIPSVGYIVFGISLLGVISVVRKRHKHGLLLLPITGLAYFILLNGTFPMTLFFEALGNVSGTLKEALRFPFTKFSIMYMLGLSVYFAFGVACLFHWLKGMNWGRGIVILLLSTGLLWYFAPGFQGNLVSKSMRVSIPQAYFELFDWFKRQPKTDRVAILPIHSFWGWVYYDWGYQGAGFLQFGIPQPILDRDHDRWSMYNEQYQREMQYAIYSQNTNNFISVLKKYNARYILLDTSITNLGGNKNATLTWLLPQLLSSSSEIQKVATFGKTITVYEYLEAQKNPAVTTTDLPDIGPPLLGGIQDDVFMTIGMYKTDKQINISNNAAAFAKNERYVSQDLGPLLTLINADSILAPEYPCGGTGVKAKRSIQDGVIRYTSTNGSVCDHFAFPSLDHQQAYVVEITSRHKEGFPIQLYICNDLNRHCGQIEHLHTNSTFTKERFFIPSYDDYGFGHTLNINNFTIKGRTSINEIQEIRLYEAIDMPFTSSQQPGRIIQTGTILSSIPGRTVIHMPDAPSQELLVYYERFHKGWKAYEVNSYHQELLPFLFGKKLKNHVLVNSWTNGWSLEPGEKRVVIFFLPQLLQVVGFILFPIPLVLLVKKHW